MTLAKFNGLSSRDAVTLLRRCCGAVRWAQEMERRRPFGEMADLLRGADDVWSSLGREDWLEAFTHHPRIGDIEDLRRRFPATAELSVAEQSAIGAAGADVIRKIAEGNELYESKFGYIFIVSAAGKSAAEVLKLLTLRLGNRPEEEIRNAAAEQAAITKNRLASFITT